MKTIPERELQIERRLITFTAHRWLGDVDVESEDVRQEDNDRGSFNFRVNSVPLIRGDVVAAVRARSNGGETPKELKTYFQRSACHLPRSRIRQSSLDRQSRQLKVRGPCSAEREQIRIPWAYCPPNYRDDL